MNKTVAKYWIVVFALAIILQGCGKSSPSNDKLHRKNAVLIGVCLTRVDEPWRKQIKEDIEKAASKLPDVQLLFHICDNDAERQRRQFFELCDAGAQAIILRPVDATSMAEPVAAAMAAHIPVIVLERPLVGDKYTSLVSSDYRQIGEAVGRWIGEQLHGKGTIVEIRGPVDSMTSDELHEGFVGSLRDPGYRFVNVGHVDPPKTDAAKLMNDAMERAENIDAVFAFDDASAYAAHEAAKEARRDDGTLFVGLGGVPAQGGVYVAAGDLAASFVLPTGGKQALDLAMKAIRGEKVPKQIVLETRPLTKTDQ